MISWPKLIILLAVIILIFGTKRLRTLGSDLGSAIKGFKNAMNDDENKASEKKDAEFLNDSEVNASQNTTNSDKKE